MSKEKSSTSSQNSTPKPSSWSPEDAKDLYGIDSWGSGYFDINAKGNVIVCPQNHKGPSVDLLDLIEDLKERGIRTPMLLRFPDITKERIKLLNRCFQNIIHFTVIMTFGRES